MNCEDDMLLMQSLRHPKSDAFVLRLIQSGSNLNITNTFGRTCLHVALSWNFSVSLNIVHKLIEHGADINARDRGGRTALHCAVETNDLEAVCMLLYYGIDVSPLCIANMYCHLCIDNMTCHLCIDNMTAFTLALYCKNLDLAEILFDYYDFSDCFLDGHIALYLAACHQSPLALKLVQAGADVNYVVPPSYNNVLLVSLKYPNAELFKLIWPKFDHRLLLEDKSSFIKKFIRDTVDFSTSDWVQCLHLILASPAALDLLNHHKTLLHLKDPTAPCLGCFARLLFRMKDLEVKPSDRIGIIASCLSLGWEADANDINFAFTLYGLGPEMELFIYGTDVYDGLGSSNTSLYLLPLHLFALEGKLGSRDVLQLLCRQIQEFDCVGPSVLQSLGFFALPFDGRQQLLQLASDFCLETYQAIQDRLSNVPEVPSLLELARNQARMYIRQNYRICQAYHMHDAVKSLHLPERFCDILLFKTALYQ